MIDYNSITNTEFGVALLKAEESHYHVPVAPKVTDALKQMLQATLDNLGDPGEWADFDCAEQYSPTERLKYPLDTPLSSRINCLFTAQNFPTAADALNNPTQIDYYFAHFRDSSNAECIGVRKATYFKGPVGKTFMHWLDGQLTIVEGNLFRLDTDFDFLIFSDHIAIYRPTQFERIAELEDELAKITPHHVQAVSTAAPQLDFEFANTVSPIPSRMRRLFAALKSRSDIANISSEKFEKACKANGIALIQKNGKWAPGPKHEIAFLEMLDRRRYNDPLIDDDPDPYRAVARKKVTST